MELKCWNNTGSPSVNFSLNRTFMELKCIYEPFASPFRMSQSYLYGIEINSVVTCWVANFVSIVPLWNWNIFGQLHKTCHRWSQSYLYGIEIGIVLNALAEGGRVSIVPLWNWNQGTVTSKLVAARSQSYLYGIEIVANIRVLISGQQVSIVPLWNWNK